MLDISDRWQLLRLTSRRPELMDRMMERMRVSFSAASRIDGGMALDEARTKCIFCRHGRNAVIGSKFQTSFAHR